MNENISSPRDTDISRKYITIIKEWLLPFIATFAGVFLAAVLAEQLSNRAEDKRFDDLLEIVHSDCYAAWRSSNSELQKLSDKDGKLKTKNIYSFSGTRMPGLMMNAIKGNPLVLAKLRIETFSELLELISDTDQYVLGYNVIIGRHKDYLDMSKLSGFKDNKVPEDTLEDAFKFLKLGEYALGRSCFLIENERNYRAGKINFEQYKKNLDATKFSIVDPNEIGQE